MTIDTQKTLDPDLLENQPHVIHLGFLKWLNSSEN